MMRKMEGGDLYAPVPQTHMARAAAHRTAQANRQARGPEHWQEAHSPTEPATVRTYLEDKATGAMKPVQVRSPAKRRKADNRVWEAMTVNQERAAIRIVRGYDLITGGQGYATPAARGAGQGARSRRSNRYRRGVFSSKTTSNGASVADGKT